eukprot:jgi/Chrzof1/245/Cz01g08180.t1
MELVALMVGGPPSKGLGTQWVAALAALIIGTLCALGSLVAGQHIALMIYHSLNPGALIVGAKPAVPSPPQQAISSPAAESASPLPVAARSTSKVVVLESNGTDRVCSTQLQPSLQVESDSPAAPQQKQTAEHHHSIVVTEQVETAVPAYTLSRLLVDAFAVVSTALLTSISMWLVIKDQQSTQLFSQQFFWFSILFGPAGCFARFYLSRLNGKLPGPWSWFPLGTYTANMSACILDFCLKAAMVRVALSSLDSSVMAGFITGVGGSLSTVSTWVVEVQKLLLRWPVNHHGYQYMLGSIISAIVLGLLIYGIPVWTL